LDIDQVLLIRQSDKLEPWFRKYLIEDRSTMGNGVSYVDFLVQLHREIRTLLGS
jgi:hypothetical protein